MERYIIHELKQPNGLSYRQIADKLGTSISTVCRIAKGNKLSKKDEK
ncbi:MAG TPA: hypothetical protein DEQ27_02850 [Prevotella sp.]|nr:hypothetical protein [Prevotella sp.]